MIVIGSTIMVAVPEEEGVLLDRQMSPDYGRNKSPDYGRYRSYKEACFALGLLDDDKEFINAITQASQWGTSEYLRKLFVALLVSNKFSRPEHVWTKTWEHLSDDIVYRQRQLLRVQELMLDNNQLRSYALAEIEKLLQHHAAMDLLPPGAGYVPSDELLVSYYLANKNNEEVQNFHGSDLIKELSLYQYDPFELHLAQSFLFPHTREFYCFTAKTDEPRRHCKTGFWMQKGVAGDIIVGADDVLVGKKSLFFFYIGNSPQNAIKTSWTMYEYTHVNNPQAPFVVCRVFDCPRGMDMDSEFGPLSDVDDGEAAGDDSDDKANEGTQNLKGLGLVLVLVLVLRKVMYLVSWLLKPLLRRVILHFLTMLSPTWKL